LSEAIFSHGETLRVQVKASGNGFLYLMGLDAEGLVYPILPNPWFPENRVTAGQTLVVPSPDQEKAGLLLTATLPEGIQRTVETILAVVSEKPIPLLTTLESGKDSLPALMGRLADLDPTAARQVVGYEIRR